MSEARTITVVMVREAMRGFCAGGQRVSNAQLYEVLGVTCEKEQDRLRTRISKMIKLGEVVRVSAGLFEYNFKFQPSEGKSYTIVWRFVRKAKPGWSIGAACQMTRISYKQVSQYVKWLEEEGYIAHSGKDGQSNLYRATSKADQTPETPYPPPRDTDPFAEEKIAAARIARLMLCHDPYAGKTAREITKACAVLLARFNKQNSTPEEENEHVQQ